MARRGAFLLLNSGGFHQRPEVLVDHLFLGVVQLGKVTQKHRCRSDVLANLSELWGIVPPVHDVAGGRDPERHSPVYAYGAQYGAPSLPAQVAAGSAANVVAPHRALV